MNRKFEDKLVRLAFGETGPRESSALERKVQSDPEAARALEEYQSLKTGLNLLTEIPPDQLSKERLRDAILGQGLKPLPVESPSPRFGWAWMPVSAAALALAWLGVRHVSAPSPQVVAPSTMAMSLKPAPELIAPAAVHTVKSVKPAVVHEQGATDRSARLVVRRHAAEQEPKPTWAVNPLTKAAKPTAVARNESAKTPQAAAPQAPADQSDSDGKLTSINGPIVVINPENDNNSGAQKATEVDGASDVGPVGG